MFNSRHFQKPCLSNIQEKVLWVDVFISNQPFLVYKKNKWMNQDKLMACA